MADPQPAGAYPASNPGGSGTGVAPGAGADRDPEIDWEEAESSPEFQALVRKRRSFVLPATIFFFTWYFGFVILAGYAESFMGERLYNGFTVGYALALTQFIMTWGLGLLYLKRADRDFDPLARKAAERALASARDRGRRPAAATDPEVTR